MTGRTSKLIFVIAIFIIGTACQRCSSSEKNTNGDDIADGMTAKDTGNDEEMAESDSASQSCDPPQLPSLATKNVAPDHTFEQPLYVTQAPGDENRLFVVEKPGVIKIVEDGEVLSKPFLDIQSRVDTSHNERGLLGLAFHPDYRENGRFFVDYTRKAAPGRNTVAEYHRSQDNPNRANPEEVRRLVDVEDPEGNHNGGMITFGPDGLLYVAFGDGGGAGDRHGDIGNGLNKETLFGSLLRLDVDAPDNDFIPDKNPFVVEDDGRDEIFAYGLRNPWRFSFDRETGHLYIGDVGQNKIEEIDVQTADTPPGQNYGWAAYEGGEVFRQGLTDLVEDHAKPITTYRHQASDGVIRNGASVVGGYVYRGSNIPNLQGYYLYGDTYTRDVGAFYYCEGEAVNHRRLPALEGQGRALVSFGQDNAGELYVVYHRSGEVKKIIDQ